MGCARPGLAIFGKQCDAVLDKMFRRSCCCTAPSTLGCEDNMCDKLMAAGVTGVRHLPRQHHQQRGRVHGAHQGPASEPCQQTRTTSDTLCAVYLHVHAYLMCGTASPVMLLAAACSPGTCPPRPCCAEVLKPLHYSIEAVCLLGVVCLQRALAHGVREVTIKGDSMLVINQVRWPPVCIM